MTVLTGFLGAGKTTVLRHVLGAVDARKICVVENEFGAANVDGEVIETMAPGLVRRLTGCICCAVQGDLVATFVALSEVCAREGVERVVLETTGMAEPGEIVRILLRPGPVAEAFRVAQVVTVADAEYALVDLENSPIAQEQVGVADLVLVSKIDRVPSARVETVIAGLNALNPMAEVRRCAHGVVDPAEFFRDTPRRLRARAVGEHGHGQLASLVVEAPGPHRLADVDAWVRTWTRKLGDDLLRVKGIVRGPRGRRTLLQAVRRTVTSERIMQAEGESWNASTFVLIGTALPTDALTSSFRALPVSGRR